MDMPISLPAFVKLPYRETLGSMMPCTLYPQECGDDGKDGAVPRRATNVVPPTLRATRWGPAAAGPATMPPAPMATLPPTFHLPPHHRYILHHLPRQPKPRPQFPRRHSFPQGPPFLQPPSHLHRLPLFQRGFRANEGVRVEGRSRSRERRRCKSRERRRSTSRERRSRSRERRRSRSKSKSKERRARGKGRSRDRGGCKEVKRGRRSRSRSRSGEGGEGGDSVGWRTVVGTGLELLGYRLQGK